jgi:hypothetical protein
MKTVLIPRVQSAVLTRDPKLRKSPVACTLDETAVPPVRAEFEASHLTLFLTAKKVHFFVATCLKPRVPQTSVN